MSSQLLKSIDLVVDFATLGEYRVIEDVGPQDVAAADTVWGADVSWQSAPRSREIECSLPRARDRALARARIRN